MKIADKFVSGPIEMLQLMNKWVLKIFIFGFDDINHKNLKMQTNVSINHGGIF